MTSVKCIAIVCSAGQSSSFGAAKQKRTKRKITATRSAQSATNAGLRELGVKK